MEERRITSWILRDASGQPTGNQKRNESFARALTTKLDLFEIDSRLVQMILQGAGAPSIAELR